MRSAERGPAPGASGIYQLAVVLRGSQPPIWRRLLVPVRCSLNDLHLVLQAGMGWQRAHLFEFVIGTAHYADKHTTHMRLGNLVRPGTRFTYRYDFGDNWEHEISVEGQLAGDPAAAYPVCIAGSGACPPEDSGGIARYRPPPLELGAPWPPPGPPPFRLAEVNQRLQRLHREFAAGAIRPAANR